MYYPDVVLLKNGHGTCRQNMAMVKRVSHDSPWRPLFASRDGKAKRKWRKTWGEQIVSEGMRFVAWALGET